MLKGFGFLKPPFFVLGGLFYYCDVVGVFACGLKFELYV